MAALFSHFARALLDSIALLKKSLVSGCPRRFCSFQEMVCLQNEVPVQATIRDTIGMGQKRQSTIVLSPSKPVNSIFSEVACEFQYQVDAIQLTVQTRDNMVSRSWKLDPPGVVRRTKTTVIG